MPQIKHKEECKHSGEHIECNDKVTCEQYDFKEWLPHIAPDFFWYDIQVVGSYQGNVFGVAKYKGQVAIYEDYYGSCSGCGAWGVGGEPTSQDEVITKCKFHNTKEETLIHLTTLDGYDTPDKELMIKAIDEILA